MTGVDAVIHAAAKISFSGRERRELWSTNIEGTANVVNAALEQNIRRVLYVSSVAALGRTGGSEEVTEERAGRKARTIPTTRSASSMAKWKSGAE